MSENNFNRRDFLRGATLGAFGLGFGLEEITAEAQNKKARHKSHAETGRQTERRKTRPGSG